MGSKREILKVLITVKTYPIPSTKYNELVCTAGITEEGQFVRLYPINFRDLPFSQQYKKYQWIEVVAEKHGGCDTRKESYRPDCATIKPLGKPILTQSGDWSAREMYVLRARSKSIEELWARQNIDGTSLGFLRPKKVNDLIIKKDVAEWKASFKAKLQQMNIWETKSTKDPPRKIPFKFLYHFECTDTRCRGHRMMIEDWEVGALFWRMVDQGMSPQQAADKVRLKFFEEVCAPDKDTHVFVGNMLKHQHSWLILGVYWPTVKSRRRSSKGNLDFFDDGSAG